MANLRSILLLLLVAFLALALISSASAQRNRNNKSNNKNKGQQQQQQRPVANKRPKPQQNPNNNPNRPNKPVQNTASQKVFTTTLSGLGKIRGRTSLTEWTGQTVMQFLDVPYGKAERFKVRSPVESEVPIEIKALLYHATVC